jgi:ubiquinone/menaquinone biosynthesis C-methylase UbiE
MSTAPRAPAAQSFDDAERYHRFMGPWSSAVTEQFLAWLAPARQLDWLDVGCGTGTLTRLAGERLSPASMCAIDASAAQVDYARTRLGARARFQVADARALPFAAHSFDVVASALVLNFVAEMPLAVAEMRRVARPGAVVAAFVWEFGTDRSPSGPMRRALQAVDGANVDVPGKDQSGLAALKAVFVESGLRSVGERTIEVTRDYRDLDEYWDTQMSREGAISRAVAALSKVQRAWMRERLREELVPEASGAIRATALANAVKALA